MYLSIQILPFSAMKFSNKYLAFSIFFYILLCSILFLDSASAEPASITLLKIYCYGDTSTKKAFIRDTIENTQLVVEVEVNGLESRHLFDRKALVAIEYEDADGRPIPMHRFVNKSIIKANFITPKIPDEMLNYSTTIWAYSVNDRKVFSEEHIVDVHLRREPVLEKVEEDVWSVSIFKGPFPNYDEEPVEYDFSTQKQLGMEFIVDKTHDINLALYGIGAGLKISKIQKKKITRDDVLGWKVKVSKGKCLIIVDRQKKKKLRYIIRYYDRFGPTGYFRYNYGTKIEHEYIPLVINSEQCTKISDLDPYTLQPIQ